MLLSIQINTNSYRCLANHLHNEGENLTSETITTFSRTLVKNNKWNIMSKMFLADVFGVD